MSKANEPAFPEIRTTETPSRFFEAVYGNVSSSGGLTKREYFAAMAMQSLINNPVLERRMLNQSKAEQFEAMVARSAMFYADALIAELEKG